MKFSGTLVEIGDIADATPSTPHGIAVRLPALGVVTIIGLSKEQVRDLVPVFCESVEITITAAQVPPEAGQATLNVEDPVHGTE